MKSPRLLLSLTTLLFSTLALAQTPSSHVLVIGIDGVRSDAQLEAYTPNLDALIDNGIYSPDALNEDITISGPGWSSILCGVHSDKHLVTGNDFSGNNYADYPSFFQRLESSYSDISTVSICHWSPINENIVGTDADVVLNTTSDEEVRDLAIEQLSLNEPHAIFLHFDDVDHAGHDTGFSPTNPTYIQAIETADSLVGEVISALYARPNYSTEDWLVLVTSDHGGVGYSHGGTSIEHRRIGFIVAAEDIPTELIEATYETLPPVENCLGEVIELHFQGDGYIEPFYTPDLNTIVEQDFSIEIRIKTTETNDVAIIGNKDWDSGYNPGFVFSFEYPNGPEWKVNVGDGDSRADATGSDVGDGEWHTLSATFDLDGNMRLYTDGVFVSEEDMSGVGNLNTDGYWYMGADINLAYNYSGALAEIRIWNTLLDDAAIAAYSCSQIDWDHPFFNNLSSYWHVDDNSNWLQNSGNNNPFLSAEVVNGTWQEADSTYIYDYTSTPRLVDIAHTAMVHMCVDIEPSWELDGISWVDPCIQDIATLENTPFELYPNPATDALFINSSIDSAPFEIISSSGAIVHSSTLFKGRNDISIKNLPPGIYIVRVNDLQKRLVKIK